MNIIKIENIEDERLDVFYRKSEKELHKAFNLNNGFFIAESELVINRALDANYKPISFLIIENEEDKYKDIFNRCDKDVLIYEVKEEIFKKLKGYLLIRGILCIFERKKDLDVEDVLKNKKRIVVLEDVENPTNVGAIFRNAIGLNADGVLLTSESCDPLYRRSIRTSMGNVFQTEYTYIDANNFIDILHSYGYKTVALALRDDAIDIEDESLLNEERLAIILGSEGYGLNQKTIDDSDYVCKIKMNLSVDSLNVASASAIALYELCMKRK